MRLPFLKTPAYEGRRVRPAPPQPVPAGPPRVAPGTPQFVPVADHAEIRAAYQRADLAVSALEGRARELLERAMPLSSANKPQLREAIRIIRGDHPVWGTASGRLQNQDPATGRYTEPVVTADIYDRSQRILARADRIALGFDVTDVTKPDFNGLVKPTGSVLSPAEAAGEVQPGTVAGNGTPAPTRPAPISEVIDERARMQKRDLWFMAFVAVFWQILNSIADLFGKMAQWVENAITVKIGPYRLKLGKYVAKPVRWIEKLFRRIARIFERQAEGLDPEEGFDAVEEPVEADPGLDDTDTGYDQNLANEVAGSADMAAMSGNVRYGTIDTREGSVDSPGPIKNGTDPHSIKLDGGSGIPYLAAAQVVTAAVHSQALDPAASTSALLNAVEEGARARGARRYLDAKARNATSLGVSLLNTSAASDGLTTSTSTATERIAFVCDAP